MTIIFCSSIHCGYTNLIVLKYKLFITLVQINFISHGYY